MPNRIVINAKDIMNMTGRSRRYALNLMTRIRKFFKKPPGSLVFVYELCEVTGIREEFAVNFLK